MSNYGHNYGAVVMTNTTHHTTYWTMFDKGSLTYYVVGIDGGRG